MQKAANKNGVAIADMFTDMEAKKAVNILTNNAATMTKNLDEMKNAAGSTAAAYATMEDTAARKIDKLKAAWEVMKLNVGGSLAGALTPVVETLTANFGQIEGPITQFFGMIADGIKAITPYLPKLLSGFSTIAKNVLPIFAKVGGIIVDKVLPPLVQVFDVLVNTILPPLCELFGVFVETLLPPLTQILQFVISYIMPPLLQLFGVFVSTILPPLLQLLQVIITTVLPPLLSVRVRVE
jgi:hypothetical protein